MTATRASRLAWALCALAVLGLALTGWFDHLIREAGRPDLAAVVGHQGERGGQVRLAGQEDRLTAAVDGCVECFGQERELRVASNQDRGRSPPGAGRM